MNDDIKSAKYNEPKKTKEIQVSILRCVASDFSIGSLSRVSLWSYPRKKREMHASVWIFH